MGLRRLLSVFTVLLFAARRSCFSLSNRPPSCGAFSEKESLWIEALASPDYLSDRVSSPERYAKALNLTVEQVADRKELYRQASGALHIQLSSLSSIAATGTEKHTLLCQHRFRYGQHPFTCRNCWSYAPVCVCSIVNTRTNDKGSVLLPSPRLDVVVWVHHSEWGLTSNTGGLVRLTLGNSRCQLLMKGLPEHDNLLQTGYLNKYPEEYLVVVLWPQEEVQKSKKRSQDVTVNIDQGATNEVAAGTADASTPGSRIATTTISLDDVRSELAAPDGRRVVLIAVDGTWRNARRMVSRLPRSIPRLDLPADVLKENLPSTISLLAPIRTKGPSQRRHRHVGGGDTMVCTAEAVASTLMALGMKAEDGQFILDVAKTKVELVRRYRGHESKI